MDSGRFTILEGAEYLGKDGMIHFPGEEDDLDAELLSVPEQMAYNHRKDGSYRTHAGPSVAFPARIIAANDRNLSIAIATRLCAVRWPWTADPEGVVTVDSKHLWYKARQKKAIAGEIGLVREYLVDIFARIPYLEAYSAAEERKNDPHPKKVLRIGALQDMYEDASHQEEVWLKTVLQKAKKLEWAKFLKHMRTIGDLGVKASLQGSVVTESLKNAMYENPFLVEGGEVRFVKTSTYDNMHKLFNDMHSGSTPLFAYFSDDSTYSCGAGLERVWFDIDISKCDTSHTGPLFDLLVETAGPSEPLVNRLVRQLCKPFRIMSADKKHRVLLKHVEAILASGSTLTTLINNVANILIGYALIRDHASDEASILASAQSVGYHVTVSSHCRFEEVTFLKKFPALDVDGEWQPFPCVGTLFRTLGYCKGDYPGRGPIEERARQFDAAVINGMFYNLSAPFLSLLRARYGDYDSKIYDKVVDKLLAFKKLEAKTEHRFTDEAIFRRYAEPEEGFFGRLTALGFGEAIREKFTDCVMLKDYDIDPTVS